jgi:hypothetical protein
MSLPWVGHLTIGTTTVGGGWHMLPEDTAVDFCDTGFSESTESSGHQPVTSRPQPEGVQPDLPGWSVVFGLCFTGSPGTHVVIDEGVFVSGENSNPNHPDKYSSLSLGQLQ